MRKYVLTLLLILVFAGALYIYYSYITPHEERKPGIVQGEPESYAGKLRLASWNLRVFSDESRDDEKLRTIVNNLNNYDFVAIIELRDEPVLNRTRAMLKTMGRDFDYEISDEVGWNVKERYAFLYDVSKVKVTKPGQIFPDRSDSFIREPYYGSFQAGKFDFTVIATHVIWGNKVSERRREIKKLAEVYEQIQDMDREEQDIILVGDFNREPDDEQAFKKLRDIPSMINLFNLPDKTIIFDSNLYDNIWFQSKYVKEYTGVSGINRFDESDFGNNDEKASLIVSDHRPVWAEFNTTRDDD